MKGQDFQNHLNGIKDFLSTEFSKLRAGRASTSLVDDIQVEAYEGSDPMPIKELASVVVPDAQSVVIAPWDKSVLKKVESAIRKADKGLNPVNEGEQIRVPVPSLTEETRKQMTKEISNLVEQAKIRVRTLRQDAIKAVEEQEDNGVISEDEMFRQKKEIERDISDINKELEELGEKKVEEVMKV